jgi:hypothetical protein
VWTGASVPRPFVYLGRVLRPVGRSDASVRENCRGTMGGTALIEPDDS